MGAAEAEGSPAEVFRAGFSRSPLAPAPPAREGPSPPAAHSGQSPSNLGATDAAGSFCPARGCRAVGQELSWAPSVPCRSRAGEATGLAVRCVCPDPARAAPLGMERGAEHGIQDPSEGTGRQFTRTSSTQNHFYYVKAHGDAGTELSSGLRLRTAARQVLDQAHEKSPAQLTSARCRGSGAAFLRTLARRGRSRGPAAAEGEAGGGFDLRRVLLAAAAPAGAVAEAPHAGQGIIGGRGGEPAGRG